MSEYIDGLPESSEGYSPCCSASYKIASSVLAFCKSCEKSFFYKSFSVSGSGIMGQKHFDKTLDQSSVNKADTNIRQFKRTART